jgi:tetratricopeptide (TPR) repeat protein
MATVYRAYRTRDDFEKYKFFTLHLTLLLVVTGVLLHAFTALLPWVFTLYICWSPWHYSGQNYGLLLMFVRRCGKTLTGAERRFLRAAFVASYLMLLASFETGGSSDPLILSLGLPPKFTLIARAVLGAIFIVLGFLALQRLVREGGIRQMAAPLTLFSTQFLWFVLPTLLELHASYQIPQTRYSSGILAVLHSAQYLWITSYYQRREARAKGQPGWRVGAYFVALIAGGIALFIPGPWLVSYAFHYDFTTSFLIFTALVNIHHFLLDGAIWKLRDTRVASLLIDRTAKSPQGEAAQPPETLPARRWWSSTPFARPAIQVALVALFFLWGGLDQLHFAMGTDEENLPALLRAARLNPYDSLTQERVAAAEMKSGRRAEAMESLGLALDANPRNQGLQHRYARELIADGRYPEAFEHYRKMLLLFPRDPDALINYGLLADRLGRGDEAISSWQKAVDADPNQERAQFYLAEALERKQDLAAAAPHWEAFLKFAQAHPEDPAAIPVQTVSAAIRLGDEEARTSQSAASLDHYNFAIGLAGRIGDAQLESLALAHLGDLQEKLGDQQNAARSYQRGLDLDAKVNDPANEAIDWFNYGQFLRHHRVSGELAYACFLRSENLLESSGGQGLETVRAVRKQVGASLGTKAAAAQEQLPALLARAAELPQSSF